MVSYGFSTTAVSGAELQHADGSPHTEAVMLDTEVIGFGIEGGLGGIG